jgi:hypothetical protein
LKTFTATPYSNTPPANMYRLLIVRYKEYMSRQEFIASCVWALVLFGASFYINEVAIRFATERAGAPVTDIILSNTKALPVDNLFVWGTFLLLVMAFGLSFAHPKRIPFMFKTAALFYLVRSIFVSLTHFGPFAPHLADDFGASINRAFFGGDLFFSGHTGLPFLIALGFWHDKLWRYIFLGTSLFFAVIVLLGHIHYTIDVLSAFFITYGIYHIALWLFPRDHTLFVLDEQHEQ